MVAVMKHAMDAIFFFQQHDASAHDACSTVHLLQCKTSFRPLWPQKPQSELNRLQYKINGVMRHHEYELQASNIEEIKQQVDELNSGKPLTAFERRDFRVFVFPQVEQRY